MYTGGKLVSCSIITTNVCIISGLTLVAAQTVFMVEPVFNEALEQQAISRVDRIGQTKEVF